ncbi:MAG: metallophosphoesterase [Variovorax sp.]|nr:MAG: metallophosphoesterase [Variovorax sp.]
MTRIGLISDTHGLLRPEALAFLQGCDHIVHGGDIGGPGILAQLAAIAPLTAVRGNNDRDAWADAVPETDLVQVGGVFLYALHDIAELDIDAASAGVQVVVTGHSHKPSIDRRDGVLYVNPGSAGPRRFSLPISVGELIVDGDILTPRIVELELVAHAR